MGKANAKSEKGKQIRIPFFVLAAGFWPPGGAVACT